MSMHDVCLQMQTTMCFAMQPDASPLNVTCSITSAKHADNDQHHEPCSEAHPIVLVRSGISVPRTQPGVSVSHEKMMHGTPYAMTTLGTSACSNKASETVGCTTDLRSLACTTVMMSKPPGPDALANRCFLYIASVSTYFRLGSTMSFAILFWMASCEQARKLSTCPCAEADCMVNALCQRSSMLAGLGQDGCECYWTHS